MLTTLEPATLVAEQVDQMREEAVVWKETTVPQASLHADHTLRNKHAVGQIVHNVHKIYRVLEKTNYLTRFGQQAPSVDAKKKKGGKSEGLQAQLEQGCPTTYSRILKYMAFDSSSAFTNYLKANGVNIEIQYLIESKFIKEISKVLIDLFKYRVALAPE